ncbi:RICIN domain-containing protein [Jannaschia sp. W003]|uniref:RICIN domain-containing protein n=1 Tax=Jannaschia sp. W003 TaxID=2867012 RepID=UPI0021A35305|nr:RICIN domain-containing protein [Jannaschia sp. W003]UWQ20133.1 RICIN domain-containing protein [Jannaschia sp. W003]
MTRFPLLAVLALVPGAALANAPQLRNTGPIIYLADNLDEADGLGYCIDTEDRGQTERVHLHSCKPDADDPTVRDVLFRWNEETGRIEHGECAGFCLSADADAAATVLSLVECSDDPAQQFAIDGATGEIHPGGDEALCLAGAAESSSAGPFMSRSLGIEACDAVDPALRTFAVQG